MRNSKRAQPNLDRKTEKSPIKSDDRNGTPFAEGDRSPQSRHGIADHLTTLASSTLDEVLHGAESVALLDFPNHGNVGDSAIWLGELEYLHRRSLRPRYACEAGTYSAAGLRARVGQNTVLLLHGGGNFGDLWPVFQQFREAVLADFPRHRIIQLPQTVWFTDEGSARRSQGHLRRHPAFRVLVRDEASYDRATGMGLDTRLCPDSAFFLGPLERTAHPTDEILWLLRSDHESSGQHSSEGFPHRGRTADWLEDEPAGDGFSARLRTHLRWRLDTAARSRPALRVVLAGALARPYDSLARQRLRRGVDLLSSAEVLVTDRLHAHILALLLGIPHVVLDTRFGKVSGFVDTWATDQPTWVRRAGSHEEAARLVDDLLIQARAGAWGQQTGTTP